MPSKFFTITYNGAPLSLNAGGTGSRRHWGVAHREKKKWEGIYTFLLLERNVPRHMSHCAVDIVLAFRRRNHRDIENYRSSVTKPLADCLVKGGWLVDDTEEFFEVNSMKLYEGSEYEVNFPPNPLVLSRTIVTLHAEYVSAE